MKITRTFSGGEITIYLTQDELYEAYKEQSREFVLDDIWSFLSDYDWRYNKHYSTKFTNDDVREFADWLGMDGGLDRNRLYDSYDSLSYNLEEYIRKYRPEWLNNDNEKED